MNASKPLIIVPKSTHVREMIEVAHLSLEPRAQRVGIVIIAPRTLRPADLMVSCMFWPKQLRGAGVTRVAVVLPVEAYVAAEPLLRACSRRMRDEGIAIAYFHEGHFESDQIKAWFEQRRPRRRVTTEVLVQLSDRYAERGNVVAATQAARLAERECAQAA
jgi:hypothetical protein